MLCALAYMSCIFFLHFFAQSLEMLLVAQILVGVPWGSECSVFYGPEKVLMST
jgi:predicted MFS family arabinose efflux permease